MDQRQKIRTRRYWSKIDEGWYEGMNGEILQAWYKAEGAPFKKKGWYVWPDPKTDELRGPFRSMREAIINLINGSLFLP